MYDEHGVIAKRGGLPIVRPIGTPTPCHKCPKKNPDEAKHYELSQKNKLTWKVWKRVKATGGRNLSKRELRDGVLTRNLATIDSIMKNFDTRQTADSILAAIAMAKTGGGIGSGGIGTATRHR